MIAVTSAAYGTCKSKDLVTNNSILIFYMVKRVWGKI